MTPRRCIAVTWAALVTMSGALPAAQNADGKDSSPGVQEVIAELWKARQLGCRLLFHVNGKPLRELKSEWRQAVQAAGLVAGRKGGGVVLYNLRHSCLTNLAEAGVPDTTARAISGHKTDSAHRRYVITQATAKATALAAMAEAVAAAKGATRV